MILRGEKCPLLTIDSTPRTIYDGNFWHGDPLNKDLNEPDILTADPIHHFVPNAKAILMLRNPVDRTLSDYRFFATAKKPFPALVSSGVKWWRNCLNQLSERRCDFGYTYGINGVSNLPPDMTWGDNGAGRIQLSMYIIYIRKWTEVFSKENLLIFNADVFDKDPINVLKEKVYPFLGLEPLSAQAEKNLKNLLDEGHIHVTRGKRFNPDKETVEMLQELYLPYNQQLEEFTGDSSFLWQNSTV